MRMIKLVFEGSVDEYAVVRPQFEATEQPAISEEPLTEHDVYDDVRRVLRRLPIPDNHRRLFQVLAAAGESGMKRSELRDALDITDGELNGVLGALGRRVNGTPGLNFNKGQGLALNLFFDTSKGHEWHYRLRPQAYKALQDEGLLEPAA